MTTALLAGSFLGYLLARVTDYVKARRRGVTLREFVGSYEVTTLNSPNRYPREVMKFRDVYPFYNGFRGNDAKTQATK